jgi:acetate kinase
MSNAILVLNAGSSSLKFCGYKVTDAGLQVMAKGLIEGLGTVPRFKAKDEQGRQFDDARLEPFEEHFGHAEAFTYLVRWLRERYAGQVTLLGIGHRMAHGGLEFIKPTLITPEVVERLKKLVPLVPLHQPHNLAAVQAVTQIRPDLPQVACFDTAFHQGRARVTERFGLPDAMFQKGLRRWGFHGLSYESVAAKFRATAPDLAAGRVIAAHLGSGASLCAMLNGRSVDTTMSFSALDGLPMGTRCGSLDAGAVLFLLQLMSRDELESLLYRKSGLLGISGVSNDVRDLLASDHPLAAEAIDFFTYRAAREVGSLTVALGGIDALIFTAGVGENSPVIRRRICEHLACLGIGLDESANEAGAGRISPGGQSPSVWVIPTDEEYVIASGTLAAVPSAAVVD